MRCCGLLLVYMFAVECLVAACWYCFAFCDTVAIAVIGGTGVIAVRDYKQHAVCLLLAFGAVGNHDRRKWTPHLSPVVRQHKFNH